MSMPITFTAPVAPASPAPAGASATSGEPGALFGAVLSGISAGTSGDPGGSTDDDRAEEVPDASAAAGSAPLGGALLIGLNLPIGDGRTVPGATTQAAVRTPVVAATPTGGTGVPPALSGTATPAPFGGAVPATGVPAGGVPAGAGVMGTGVAGTAAAGTGIPAGGAAAGGAPGTGGAGTGVAGTGVAAAPSTPDTAAARVAGATAAVVAGTPSTQDTPTVPVAGAPVLPATQAFAGAAAAAALTGTLAGSVAGATAAGTTSAAGAPKVVATDPVARVATGPPGDASSTVDPGTGSAVGTTARSRHAFGDTASGQNGGDGALPRGPEAGWAPTLAAARADSAAPTAPGQAPAPQLPPAAQLALRLAPLRAGPDGTHQLTILLNPEELGPVSVVATVKGDQLSVQLTGATEVGRDALRAALPDLERDLRDGGFATLNLNVRDAPQPDPRPAWATPAATQPAQAAQAAPGAAAVTPTATDGTATTTTGTKTDGQPIGQVLQPDGSGPIRRDDSTGQYSAAGAVAATHQSAGAQSGGANTGNGAGQQQLSAQLNLGQPGGQPGQQPDQPGFTGGRHPGPAPDNGDGTQAGHPAPGETDPPAAGNRPANRTGVRSVDLRV